MDITFTYFKFFVKEIYLLFIFWFFILSFYIA